MPSVRRRTDETPPRPRQLRIGTLRLALVGISAILWACSGEPPAGEDAGAELRAAEGAREVAELRPFEAAEPAEGEPNAAEANPVPPEVLAENPPARIPGEAQLRRLLEGRSDARSDRDSEPEPEAEPELAAGSGSAARSTPDDSGAFDEARAALEAAKARVAQKSEALTAARETADSALAEVDAVERELRAAESELRRSEESLEALGEVVVVVDDAELFRLVQRELLEAGALARVAISAEVNDGEVTLRGVVPDEETRSAAEQIARMQPGVRNVANEIRVKRARGPHGG